MEITQFNISNPPNDNFFTADSSTLNKHDENGFYDGKNSISKDILLSDSKGQIQQREFVIFNHIISSNIEVFVSKQSLIKYKSFQKNPNNDMQLNIDEHHGKGRYIPLLKADVSNNIFSSKYLTIYKFKVPEVGKKFNPKADRFVFCKVRHSKHTRCHQYTLNFDPSPGDPSQRFTIDMYRHRSLPIVDYTIKDRRYRWVYISQPGEIKYSYILYELDADQPSMTDNMNSSEEIPNNSNPIMKFSMKAFLTPNSNISTMEFRSSNYIGELKDLRGSYFDFNAQTAMFVTSQKFATTITDNESIFSVDNSTLVNISLALVLKRHKDNQKEIGEAVIIAT